MQTSKFKPVRHNSKDPTPFLKKNFERYCSNIPKDHQVADLGCGNMRNTNYLKSLGYYNVWAFDKVPDCGGLEIDLGTELIPLADQIISIVLCNYVLCFLNELERMHLVFEMSRIAEQGGIAFVEMFPAKNSYPFSEVEIIKFLQKKTHGFSRGMNFVTA